MMLDALPLSQLSQEMLAVQRRLASRQAAGQATGQATGQGLPSELSRFIGRVGSRLNKPPRIVLLGEFNAGKSTLANALIGAEVLPTSIHANTRVPLLIHYSDTPTLTYEGDDRVRRPISMSAFAEVARGSARMLRVGVPLPRLKTFELIDTPGFATGYGGAVDEFCVEACRRSHVAIWCTVATQAWKASEAAMWSRLPCRLRQRSILAVTHADGIHNDRDRQRLMERLAAEAAPHFSGAALIATCDAHAALATPEAADASSRWASSGGRELEQRLRTVLDTELNSRQTAAERLLQKAAQRLLDAAPRASSLLAT